MRRRLVAVILALVAIAAFGAPAILAAARTDPTVSAGVREEAVDEARLFFDNPSERLLQLAFAVTEVAPATGVVCAFGVAGRAYVVEAFTLFGVPAGRVVLGCDGGATRL